MRSGSIAHPALVQAFLLGLSGPGVAAGWGRRVLLAHAAAVCFRSCDGFRMPAHDEAGPAHRGPVSESRQGRKAREVGRPAQRAMGIWEADAVQRGPVDAAGAAAGKAQQGATGRMGVVPAMVAGRSWVVERCRWALRLCVISPAMNQRYGRLEETSEIAATGIMTCRS